MAPSLVTLASSLLLLSSCYARSLPNIRVVDLNIRAAAPAVPATLPGTWTSQGCYTDGNPRTLADETYTDTTGMTVESCISFCDGAGFVYSGVEYAQECYCSNTIASSGATTGIADCNMACKGAAAESCGGPNRLNVFWNGETPPAAPTSPATVGLWASLGCYSDSAAARTLPIGTGTTGKVTVESCTTACHAAGYVLAGMEYSQECYCANDFSNNGAPVTDGCTMTCAGNSSEYCGGSNRLNVYAYNGAFSSSSSSSSSSQSSSSTSTSTSTSTSSSSGTAATAAWNSLGCYTDDVADRTLVNRLGTTGDVTAESCTAACKAAGYTLAGTEYSTECYCANTLGGTGAPAQSGCTMACQGNDQEMCGGPNRLNVYSYGTPDTSSTSSSSGSGSSTSTSSGTTPSASGWSSLGCYSDSVTARSMRYGPMAITGQLTVEKCQAACAGSNYILSGVEYSVECYCDNTFQNGAAAETDGCTMPCAGDNTEMCGGANRLNVYQYSATGGGSTSSSSSSSSSSTSSSDSGTSGSGTGTSTSSGTDPAATGWNKLGCYTDSVNQRTLAHGVGVNGNSVESCTATCYTAGYKYAGMEYADECYCGSTIDNGGVVAPDGDALCNMPCAGAATEMCGGPNRLSVYSYTGDLPTPAAGNNGNTGNTGTGASVAPVTSGLPTPWTYNGCWVDGANGRIMSLQQPDAQGTMTVESCISGCASLGYGIAGMEYSFQCFCSNSIINAGTKSASDADCSTACAGNGAEACGGPNRLSVYANTTTVTALPVPVPQKDNLPGNWEYKGCMAEPGAVRIFPYKLEFTQNNTAGNCLKQCSDYGYPAGGMEYGQECWCGDVADVANQGGVLAAETDCSMACSGDPIHLCGAGNRLSYYEWTGTSLQTWNTPEQQGEYQFLIGGVVIPLITTLGTNNKVTFVEKHGSGPPNSTGAYELDLSLTNDFDKAWRTMNLKTDVFCSASLTLPDKVGRQLNIGGWSVDSLYGVRLYWPDGSPGVDSKNDWQENVDELHLQRGRWYPTAVIMANGSILVVGGEDGSNGIPVPSLEILPTPAGGDTVLEMEWLNRTDPNNLYPFLFVLPSGGIFVIYYNEARILDETTFETIRTLPNIPGSVNNFLAGRTYPMEGTSVLLPQYPPYTDPVTVLTCGGSTLGAAVALDNCVTIQPEVEGAEWAIERMPNKRVMTCMTTLPDGTYMIMNGAQQGVAGFGLATDPNLEALLYDPTQKLGSRFSRMANTTIARLYHSEAILLQDGRVLITGSDPEDFGAHPQEYRVEVFIPPYLQVGNTQPELTIIDTDWTYTSQHQFTAKLHQGAAKDVRVSLLAAVSSTHGNSMNQRIFFPDVSCSDSGSGTVSCTVTAPPNSHVCPPGWFQMFVLDGPTPSWSTWVRIGGDPASLGNWPQYDDFNVPGV